MAKRDPITEAPPAPASFGCASCGDTLEGDVLPVFHGDAVLCPPCFVGRHGAKRGGVDMAVHCARCGKTSLSSPGRGCPNCGWRQVTVSAPK